MFGELNETATQIGNALGVELSPIVAPLILIFVIGLISLYWVYVLHKKQDEYAKFGDLDTFDKFVFGGFIGVSSYTATVFLQILIGVQIFLIGSDFLLHSLFKITMVRVIIMVVYSILLLTMLFDKQEPVHTRIKKFTVFSSWRLFWASFIILAVEFIILAILGNLNICLNCKTLWLFLGIVGLIGSTIILRTLWKRVNT
jgi:hypothetical protein